MKFCLITSFFLQDGTCSVAWVPPVPGEYKIHVKLSGNPVKGSPFVVVVAGEGQKRAHLSVGSTSEVFLFFHISYKYALESIMSPFTSLTKAFLGERMELIHLVLLEYSLSSKYCRQQKLIFSFC